MAISKIKLFFRLLGKYTLSMALPSCIILYYTIEPIKNLVTNYLIKNELHDWFKTNELFIVIGGYLLIPLLMIVYDYQKRIANIGERKDNYKILISKLGDYQSAKIKTFYQYPETANAQIVDCIKPEAQLVIVRSNIIQYFTRLYDDDTIWCDFFSYKNNRLEYLGQDEPTHVNLKVINDPKSTAMKAVSTGKIVIIQNTKKISFPFIEKFTKIPFIKKYIDKPFVEDKTYDIRSIICYPLLEIGNPVYIMNISSKKADAFFEKNISFYEFVLDEFAKQIHLELIIKNILEISYAK